MVVKRLSCVFRLTDGCTNKPLKGGEAGIYLGGERLRHQYKEGGYFVITDLPFGEYTLEIKAVGFQTETVAVNVDESAAADVVYLALNPSREHPAVSSMSCASGTAAGVGTLYVVRPQGKMCVAEEKSAAGAQTIKMFCEGRMSLPMTFLLGEGAHAEFVTITADNDGVCSASAPLKYAHKRSESALPLIRLGCEDGFFVMLPQEFSPDKQTGKIALKFAAKKAGKIVYANAEILPKKINDLGELKLKGEK